MKNPVCQYLKKNWLVTGFMGCKEWVVLEEEYETFQLDEGVLTIRWFVCSISFDYSSKYQIFNSFICFPFSIYLEITFFDYMQLIMKFLIQE